MKLEEVCLSIENEPSKELELQIEYEVNGSKDCDYGMAFEAGFTQTAGV